MKFTEKQIDKNKFLLILRGKIQTNWFMEDKTACFKILRPMLIDGVFQPSHTQQNL